MAKKRNVSEKNEGVKFTRKMPGEWDKIVKNKEVSNHLRKVIIKNDPKCSGYINCDEKYISQTVYTEKNTMEIYLLILLEGDTINLCEEKVATIKIHK